MSLAWITYVVGAVIVLMWMLALRTGDAYTDQPISGCILAAVLWPLLAVICAGLWLAGDFDD